MLDLMPCKSVFMVRNGNPQRFMVAEVTEEDVKLSAPEYQDFLTLPRPCADALIGHGCRAFLRSERAQLLTNVARQMEALLSSHTPDRAQPHAITHRVILSAREIAKETLQTLTSYGHVASLPQGRFEVFLSQENYRALGVDDRFIITNYERYPEEDKR